MTEIEIEQRAAKAVALFESGYNCSQAVFMAYSDKYGIDSALAASLATSFGGGMGRLREVCGAVSGMFMVLGLHYPFIDAADKKAKDANYKAVQRTAKEFKSIMGSYNCAELLHLQREAQHPVSEERTAQYYASRSCKRCVELAAQVIGKEIQIK